MPARSRSRWRLPTRRRASVTWAAASDLAHAGPGGLDEQRLDLVEAVDDLGLAAVEQRRQHPVGDDRRRRHAGLAVEPADAGRSSRSPASPPAS